MTGLMKSLGRRTISIDYSGDGLCFPGAHAWKLRHIKQEGSSWAREAGGELRTAVPNGDLEPRALSSASPGLHFRCCGTGCCQHPPRILRDSPLHREIGNVPSFSRIEQRSQEP